MDANKASFAALGGWNTAQEKAIQTSKAALVKAEKYAKAKDKEKTYSELGCPCVGKHSALLSNCR